MVRRKTRNEILTFLIGSTILLFILYLYDREYQSWEKAYSVGTVKSIQAGYKSDRGAEYTFRFMGQIHKGSWGIGNNKVKVGEKYIVEIPLDHFSRNRMKFKYKVPDSTNVPLYGWDEIPKEIIEYNKDRF